MAQKGEFLKSWKLGSLIIVCFEKGGLKTFKGLNKGSLRGGGALCSIRTVGTKFELPRYPLFYIGICKEKATKNKIVHIAICPNVITRELLTELMGKCRSAVVDLHGSVKCYVVFGMNTMTDEY